MLVVQSGRRRTGACLPGDEHPMLTPEELPDMTRNDLEYAAHERLPPRRSSTVHR
jgi:hypothetical protein